MILDINEIFTYPYDNDLLLRKQKSLRRQLLARDDVNYIDKRIAILNGSTTDDIKNILEIFLLYAGIRPSFYQSEYNKYYEDAVFGNTELDEFNPEIVVVFTSVVNIINKPHPGDSQEDVVQKLEAEMSYYQQIWQALESRYHCVIIQNNMDLPYHEPLGSLGAVAQYGMSRFIEAINTRFSEYANTHQGLYIHDLHGLSASVGLSRWHNRLQYYAYKFAMNYDVMPDVANGLGNIIKALLGKGKKCLVLDLDNTLWGGVIGDDGVDNIQLGHETPVAEAYTAFQEYVSGLKKRGVILAVSSKNEEDIAKSGFCHPDSVLKVSDFISFHANWEPKNINIKAIAEEISIGTDSLVFIDDNPVERQLVRDSMPEVAVPEVNPDDVFSYIRAIEGAGYFEPVAISSDDMHRNAAYMQNKQRQQLASTTANYDEFLQSLDMVAEIDSFKPVYYDRIAQLTNKSNQFNLTTKRYTRTEIEKMANDGRYITLYGRLSDKFGDNGLISVVIAEKIGQELHIRLWLMSCRVLKRGMEQMMLDALVNKAKEAGCTALVGYYYKSAKNKLVAELYKNFGFELHKQQGDDTIWHRDLMDYISLGKHIRLVE